MTVTTAHFHVTTAQFVINCTLKYALLYSQTPTHFCRLFAGDCAVESVETLDDDKMYGSEATTANNKSSLACIQTCLSIRFYILPHRPASRVE